MTNRVTRKVGLNPLAMFLSIVCFGFVIVDPILDAGVNWPNFGTFDFFSMFNGDTNFRRFCSFDL